MLLRSALWMRVAHFLSLHKILRKFINLKLFYTPFVPMSIKIFGLIRSLREKLIKKGMCC